MSRLVSYLFLNAADNHLLTPVVESYPLNELRLAATMHMYPPQPAASASLDSHPSVTMSSTTTSVVVEFTMVLFDNAREPARRKRDDDDQRLQMTLGLHEAQQEARIERDTLLAEKDALFQYKARVTREKLLAEKEAELARFSSEYSSKIASLDSQMQQANTTRSLPSPAWCHLVGKRPVTTCTNIVGFSIISDASSESDGDEEPQIGIGGDAAPPLTSLLADVPIQNATVGMLVEALAKANVQELFHMAFHFAKDDEYMLHVTALCEAISSFMHRSGMGPDPLELQWDMTTTHNSKWNQKVIDILCSQYTSLLEKNQWTSRSRQSIMENITNKFNQCRKCWRKAQPRVLSDGIRETMQEIGDRLVDQTNK
ncbi:uncharacterized protein EDB91DRAFT_1248309 [Suillus paluster]|uniref:uncharacterized protein n=1 Tax=Suillus paluster TaxID=48578 RepID=UPI001B860800|nr:uncharacterized protein EDB91DRAFT_1248309 [Suillus paluster]KAG1740427.1 hypothetical protein EDB91DRAFT_1248309 [Suillus paluster]